MSACLRFTRRVWKAFLDNKGHDVQCFPNLQITRAIPGTLEASLKIEPYNLNRVSTVHGGLILSMTDTIGSLAISTKGLFMTGVSTDVGATFVKPGGKVGDMLKARAVVTSIGRSLAFTRVEFFNEAGDMVAYGHHSKYLAKAVDDPRNVKLSDDGETLLQGDIVD